MTTPAEAAVLKTATALSYVCGHREELAELLDESGSPLQQLAAEAGREVPSDSALVVLLDTLHTVIQHAGDPAGVYGGTGRSLIPVGVGDMEVVYRCPLRLCIGRPGPDADGVAPRCHFDPDGADLLRERLR
ncbi:hypothetical protein [Streptomyces sp. NBC_01285]|uniref:hypothetical protein n=1 Tax=Streptomyces sp. NBC_01285 TaxID=2903813 RepID=UPI0022576D51|nr:hypothetical protein [Streptomyces sp. NBC_01285]MCX4769809.1 hypothetical protein [Streptomyces sp. NBC_01285]